MIGNPTLDIVRICHLLDAYGADPDHWPADERAEVSTFIAKSPEAARMRDRAALLDRMLDQASTHPPSERVRTTILSAAPGRSDDWLDGLRTAFGPLWRPAAALAACLALGIGLGTLTAPAEPGDDEIAMLLLGPGWEETP